MKLPSNFWHWCGEAALFVLLVLLPGAIIMSLALVNPMSVATVRQSGGSNDTLMRCNYDMQRGYYPSYCR